MFVSISKFHDPALARAPSSALVQGGGCYSGPERRAPGASPQRITPWLAATLDELDFGVVLLTGATQVVHANHVARTELDAAHPLQLLGAELRAHRPNDVAPFADALQAAAHRGLRKLLTLGEGAQRVSVSVVPLQMTASSDPTATLVMLGKRRVCGSLAVDGYARSHGLTGAETRVLGALCRGASPNQIAAELGVGIATVRTQITCIRQKTGAESICGLVHLVATLPPMVGVLRGGAVDLGGSTRMPVARPVLMAA